MNLPELDLPRARFAKIPWPLASNGTKRCSTSESRQAVGTDLFEIAASRLYGVATYSYKGRVELMAAFIMLIGAAVGAQIGAVGTKYFKGSASASSSALRSSVAIYPY